MSFPDITTSQPIRIMAWYVALVAIVNLGLGYALAVFLRAGRDELAWSSGELLDATEAWEE